MRLPEWPAGWWVVGRSSELRRGALLVRDLVGRDAVIARDEAGRVFCVDAYCPHMGAHLCNARVAQGGLVCPLHAFRIDAAGTCRGAEGFARASARRFEVVDRDGLLFARLGGALAQPPGPDDADDYVWSAGTPVEVDAHWHAMMVNGFDLLHLRSVHHRDVVDVTTLAPTEVGGAPAFRIEYVSRVVGGGASDLAMKWLSRDRIHVRQTCYGSTVVVETRLGSIRTSAVLGLLPVSGGRTRAFGTFGVERGRLSTPRLALARALFLAFLRRDFDCVQKQVLSLDGVDDEGVRGVGEFLAALPDLQRAPALARPVEVAQPTA